MKYARAIIATTHVDRQGDQFALEALESLAEHINDFYLPVTCSHDLELPPIGRIVSAKVVRLHDGEYGVETVSELFESTDPPDSLAGDGREVHVDELSEDLEILYDREILEDDDGKELLRALGKLLPEGREPTGLLKKAVEPRPDLVIALGSFVAAAVAGGFLKKIGEDLYEKLKESLLRYFAKRRGEKTLRLIFRFAVLRDGRPIEISIVLGNPAQDLERLLSSRFDKLDDTLRALPLSEADVRSVVFGYEDEKILLRYMLRSDAVPVLPDGDGSVVRLVPVLAEIDDERIAKQFFSFGGRTAEPEPGDTGHARLRWPRGEE